MMADRKPHPGAHAHNRSMPGSIETAISRAEFALMFVAEIPCDSDILASERGDGVIHGAARWRLRLDPCMVAEHAPVLGVICDSCASWLNQRLRDHVRSEGEVCACQHCGGRVDVLASYTLHEL
ncbi:hypothetical protein ACT17_15285 [Mycolicibacterium conceptionense]|uniref:Uncharacterized protein n=1 Tax=Mycolicibacterium conceptionense TaxID=451644 RepID=A0A0J8U8A0_9MYCO|nr:hypothetical protein [Mycolicibacterium conceptionense]KMV17641.1 hypothetical protein ACT17_15285 [Mycolicibacterium conceptionense]